MLTFPRAARLPEGWLPHDLRHGSHMGGRFTSAWLPYRATNCRTNECGSMCINGSQEEPKPCFCPALQKQPRSFLHPPHRLGYRVPLSHLHPGESTQREVVAAVLRSGHAQRLARESLAAIVRRSSMWVCGLVPVLTCVLTHDQHGPRTLTIKGVYDLQRHNAIHLNGQEFTRPNSRGKPS